MRRTALVCVAAGLAVFASGCSSDDPQPGPMEPPAELAPVQGDQQDLTLRCRNHGLIVVQLAAILSSKPPARLYQQAVVKFAMVEVALLLRKKPLAQTRALDLIDFLLDNRANLINPNTQTTRTRLANVTDAILCIVGLQPTGVVLGPNTGIGVVPANNQQPVIITTPLGDAGIRVPIGSAPNQDVNGNPIPGVVVTVTGLGINDTLATPLDKYGQTIDLTASQEVLWLQGGVTVAICVAIEDDVLFDAIIDRLRLGHEGGVLPKFGAIEILPPAASGDVTAVVGGCGPSFGNRSAFEGLRQFATRMLLPEPLHATAAALLKTGGVGGTTRKFSKFGAVDPELALVAQPTSTAGIVGAPVAQPPSVLVRTQVLNTPISGIEIEFDVPDGSPGTISPAEVTTGSNGVAGTTSWTLGQGQNTVNATAVPPIGEITFTPLSVTFTAEGAPPAPAFGASGWSFLVQPVVPESNAWTTLPYPVTGGGWNQATAPFGSVPLNGQSPNNCAGRAPTAWPVSSVILLRRDFFVPAGTGTASISVKIDNDTRVFLNGIPLGGLVSHEGCAETNLLPPFIAGSGVLIPGAVNRLAVLGVDRGSESFADVQVTLD